MLKNFFYKKVVKYRRFKFRQQRKKEGTIISNKASGYEKVFFEGENGVPERCNFSGNIKIGKFSTLGINNFFTGNLEIGKFCQIGADVSIHTINHPINFLSTYINKRLFNGDLKKLTKEKQTIVGNDVWIGHGSIILGGLKIGNGAIIAAGSVVTKDVPPFSIVAGVPAKIVKYRFAKTIIDEIQDLKWWDLSENELKKIKNLFLVNYKNRDSIYE